jgi:hypothetical protein
MDSPDFSTLLGQVQRSTDLYFDSLDKPTTQKDCGVFFLSDPGLSHTHDTGMELDMDTGITVYRSQNENRVSMPTLGWLVP